MIIRIIILLAFSMNYIIAQNVSLPSNIEKYVKTKLSKYVLPKTSDFMKNWEEYLDFNDSPYMVIADFNDDGKDDCAVILIDQSKSVNTFIINSRGDWFEHHLIKKDDRVNGKIQTVLSLKKKGEWESATEVINSKVDGLSLNNIDDSITFTYYWNGKKYTRILWD